MDESSKSPLTVPSWQDLIGKPFAWGGRGPDAYDCYGLIAELHARRGEQLPAYESVDNHAQIAALMAGGMGVWQECAQQPGAIVGIRIGSYVCHVGFMVDRLHMVHTWERSGGVVRERLTGTWDRRIAGFYRFNPQ